MRAGPDPLVWWRAAGVAAMTFLVGAVGHVGPGGLLPSWLVLAVIIVAGTVLSAVVLADRATTRRIVLLVVGGQMACHALFSLTAGHRGDTASARVAPAVPAPSGGARTGSLHDHYEATTAHLSTPALTIPDPAALVDHLPMFAAHALAAALVGMWLAVGERALWALLTLVVTLVVARLLVSAPPLPPAGGPTPVRRRPAALPCLGRVSRCVVRRGPPLLLVT